MVFFRRQKSLTHKQCSTIGFVLAVISLLTTSILTTIFPKMGAFLNGQGVYHMDLFLLAFIFTIFMAVQGLLLFGFPLFYAQDKKSHMTGFQILIYELMWMILLVLGFVMMFSLMAPEVAVEAVTEIAQ